MREEGDEKNRRHYSFQAFPASLKRRRKEKVERGKEADKRMREMREEGERNRRLLFSKA